MGRPQAEDPVPCHLLFVRRALERKAWSLRAASQEPRVPRTLGTAGPWETLRKTGSLRTSTAHLVLTPEDGQRAEWADNSRLG